MMQGGRGGRGASKILADQTSCLYVAHERLAGIFEMRE